MKILLINPEIQGLDVKRQANFPLGLGYIATVIREAGIEPQILDILIQEYDKKFVEDYIKNNKFDYIGITGIITSFVYIAWLSRIIKKYHKDTIIFCGGSLATTSPKELLYNSKVDIVILSEGEVISRNLLEKFKKGEAYQDLKGIAYKGESGQFKQNEMEKRIDDLDTIKFPAWDLFDMDRYMNTCLPLLDLKWRYSKRWINIISSRGCPFACTFCGKTFGQYTRLRSAKNILEEIKYLQEKYGLEHVNFCDDFFSVDKSRAIEICELLINLKKKISWTASVRADSLDDELVKKMSKAGCKGYCIGIESADQGMLDSMNKTATVEIYERAIALSHKHNIFPHCSMIIGLPGESKQTVRTSVEFLKKNKVFPIPFNFLVPLPGSKVYKDAMSKGLIKDEYQYLLKINNEFHSKLLVNCTDMSDEELISAKFGAEAELRRHYLKRHPLWGVKRLYAHLSHYGPSTTLKKLSKSLGFKL
jgi:radical SAM superfamily enzyme YgiQ (UPF0313 family)